jgi:hypothetical protein
MSRFPDFPIPRFPDSPMHNLKPPPHRVAFLFGSKKMPRTHSKEQIIAAIQQCAQELGRAPTIAELLKMRPMSRGGLYRRFANYRSALDACGLESKGPGFQADERRLFLDWAAVTRSLGKLPTMTEFEVHGTHSAQPLLKRFRTWRAVPGELQLYARATGIETAWTDVMEIIDRGRSSARSTVQRLAPWQGSALEDQPVYGAPLTWGPLTFAPTHEGGVIFLFGTVAEELGLAVLRIQLSFPDCEAMREVRPGQWQRVRIEFEFESRNFLAHGHPVAGCDVIVCWSHNWEDCPLEVIELKKVIQCGGRG